MTRQANNRIDNEGGSYGFSKQERESYVVNEEPEIRTFISHNLVENGIKGSSLGDGYYLHFGEPESEKTNTSLPKDLEHRNSRIHGKSRLEHEHSARDYQTQEEVIISATPTFDFITNQAELVVEYSNKKTKVIRATNKEVIAWLHQQTVRNLIQ